MKPYTPELLRAFDRLTKRLSSPHQMERINARLQMYQFVKEHGKDVCNTMFAELQVRDKKATRPVKRRKPALSL